MAQAAYDDIAEWYNNYINEGSQGSLYEGLILPALLELVGDVQGQHIVDIACGQGVVSRRLAAQGSTVLGVDLSRKLLEMACRFEKEQPLGISYQQDDAQKLSTLADSSFDGAVCNMALMDIPDLEEVIRSVRRVLVPGGWFAFCITHPCFQTPNSRWLDRDNNGTSREVWGYFDEEFWVSDNPLGVRSRVGAHHRTLSTYANTLVEAGFALQHISEPQATGHVASRIPGYEQVPAILLMKAIKI
jgi:ubiquinone/menaquinone biosynthesis C-methylase UbiE